MPILPRQAGCWWTAASSGSAAVHSHFVRLTPDRQSKKGAVWASTSVGVSELSATLKFRISGQGKKYFGDGMALWLTDSRSYRAGDFHGSTEKFKGLGIIFDTFKNAELLSLHPRLLLRLAKEDTIPARQRVAPVLGTAFPLAGASPESCESLNLRHSRAATRSRLRLPDVAHAPGIELLRRRRLVLVALNDWALRHPAFASGIGNAFATAMLHIAFPIPDAVLQLCAHTHMPDTMAICFA